MNNICENAFIDNINCCDLNCKNRDHHETLDNMYEMIITALKDAANYTFKNNSKRKTYVQPGWNNTVKNRYETSKHYFRIWKNHGRQNHGRTYQLYKKQLKYF